MSEDAVRLIRESLDPKLDPIEVSTRLDRSYQLFIEGGRKLVSLSPEETHQVLGLIAYGHVTDVESYGAGESSAASRCSNPRLIRFEDRFRHVAEMTGIEASWDKYLQDARREYRSKPREYGKPGERTIRSGRFGAPGQRSE